MPSAAELPRADRSRALEQVVEGSANNLVSTWDERRALFPFSSRHVEGTIVHDYDQPLAVRYTINSLLGLVRATQSSAPGSPELVETDRLVDRFLALRAGRLADVADLGLLTLLLVESGRDSSAVLGELRNALDRRPLRSLVMQDLAWATWGASAAARAGSPGGRDVAARTYSALRSLADESTGLARHSTRSFRAGIVSFGALVYYLRALHEVAGALDDAAAAERFIAGVSRLLQLQGPQGEWPWMLDPRSGRIIDPYPVFGVHQDSMAMLFLLPAIERGLTQARAAVHRSLDWSLGANELSRPMYEWKPFFFPYRSIERVEALPRLRRYLRALPGSGNRRGETWRASRVRVNDECRSYHPGWILYVWSGRSLPELPEGTPAPAADSVDESAPGRSLAVASSRPTKRSGRELVWIDVDNPPQVQYLLPLIDAYARLDADVVVTAKDNGITFELLAERRISYHPVGAGATGSKASKAIALLRRARELRRLLRQEGIPDFLVCASRSAVTAAAALRIPSFAFVDYEFVDMSVYRMGGAWILHPELLDGRVLLQQGGPRKRLVPFPGIKEDITFAEVNLDAVVPHRFENAVPAGSRLVLFRPPAERSHYHKEATGMLARACLERLAAREDVVVVFSPRYSWQTEMLAGIRWEREPMTIAGGLPFLSLLAAVDGVITAGGTMAREAAYLGIPAASIFQGPLGGVDEYLASIGRLKLVARPESLDDFPSRVRTPGFAPLFLNPDAPDDVAALTLETVAGVARKRSRIRPRARAASIRARG
jgi:predicted glycosyltransferase